MILIKDSLIGLINLEKTLTNKLELLTAIGVTTSNEETFESCEEIRDELMELCKERTDQWFDDLSHEESAEDSGDSGFEEFEEISSREQAIEAL